MNARDRLIGWWNRRETVFKVGRVGKVVLEVAFIIASTLLAWIALDEYKTTNRTASREQLYQTEQLISSREIEDPELLSVHFSFDDIPPEDHALNILEWSLPNTDLGSIGHVSDVANMIYNTGSGLTDDHRKLIRLELHSETYLYHLHNVFDYAKEGVIGEPEGDTWLGLINSLGPHPAFLTALYLSHEDDYISRDFAVEIQSRLLSDEYTRGVIESFYPEMLESSWPDKLPDY